MLDPRTQIEAFLDGSPFAVAGASRDRDKFGNKVLRCYQQARRTVFPVHPKEALVEGLTAYPDLVALPQRPHGLSLVTPPAVTRSIVDQAISFGIPQLWMQPGAEDEVAVERALAAGIGVIHGGPCILIALGFREA